MLLFQHPHYNLSLRTVIRTGHNGNAIITEIFQYPCFIWIDNKIPGYNVGVFRPVFVVVDEMHLHAVFDMLHLIENLRIDRAAMSGNAVIATAYFACTWEMPCRL